MTIHSHATATASGIATTTTTTTTITTGVDIDTHMITHVYYVDGTDGDDGYDGLAPTLFGSHGAFKTFAKAASVVVDYDQVYVRAGTYSERVAFTKTIKFSNYNGEAVIIDGTGVSMASYQGMIDFNGTIGTHLPFGTEICGFTIQYVGPDTTHAYNAIYGRYLDGIDIHDVIINDVVDSGIMLRNCYNITIHGNLVKNCAHCAANMDESISLDSCFDSNIYDNEVCSPDITAYTQCSIGICVKSSYASARHVIHDNYVHHMCGNGIYSCAWTAHLSDVWIYNNHIHDIECLGIAIGDEHGGGLENVYAYDNLIYRIAKAAIELSVVPAFSGTLTNIYTYNNTCAKSIHTWYCGIDVTTTNLAGMILIRNNIVFWHDADLGADTQLGQIRILDAAVALCTIDHNIVWGENDYQPPKGEGYTEADNFGGETWADPLFVNWANDDYRLQAGSPCRNAGLVWDNWVMPDTDYLDNPRECGSSIDVGCYEYQE